MEEKRKLISVAIPCYNEEKNIESMALAVTEQMQKFDKYDYEIVFRDNSSTDNSIEILRRLATKDPHIKVIVNRRNYGFDMKKNTMSNRIHGDVIISIPCDFQEPPELIPEFIKWWECGYEVVCGQKIGSEEGIIKYGLRSFFYKIISFLSDVPQYEHLSGIVLMSQRISQMMLSYEDADIDTRYFLADTGCPVKLIPYKQKKRKKGKSNYNIWSSLSFSIDSMITVSTKPLRIATVSGVLLSFLSFIIGLIYLIQKMIWWDRFSLGTAPVLIGMFFIGSVQLLFIGILGEYVARILNKVTKSAPPLVKELINIDNNDEFLVKDTPEMEKSSSKDDFSN